MPGVSKSMQRATCFYTLQACNNQILIVPVNCMTSIDIHMYVQMEKRCHAMNMWPKCIPSEESTYDSSSSSRWVVNATFTSWIIMLDDLEGDLVEFYILKPLLLLMIAPRGFPSLSYESHVCRHTLIQRIPMTQKCEGLKEAITIIFMRFSKIAIYFTKLHSSRQTSTKHHWIMTNIWNNKSVVTISLIFPDFASQMINSN